MALFTKTDDGTYVTYTGIVGTPAEGSFYVVKKDSSNTDVHTITPLTSQTAPQTWESLVADLDVWI